MEKIPYRKKLSHPDWQRKRLEILKRDNFTCQNCDAIDKELHVHHIYYLPNTLPQDYPLEAFITLCYECHIEEEQTLKELHTVFISELRKTCANALAISYFLSSAVKYLSCKHISLFELANILAKISIEKTDFKSFG